jgi:hypothetical protein
MDDTKYVYEQDAEGVSGQTVGSIAWTASEFVQNEKSKQWFFLLSVFAIVLAVIIFFLTDWISAVVVLLALLTLGVVGARPPRTLQYLLDDDGIHIENKSYPYEAFRSFSLIDEGAIDCIQLTPLKRVMPPITIYFSPEDAEKILVILSTVLPHEERERELIDRLMSRLHF